MSYARDAQEWANAMERAILLGSRLGFHLELDDGSGDSSDSSTDDTTGDGSSDMLEDDDELDEGDDSGDTEMDDTGDNTDEDQLEEQPLVTTISHGVLTSPHQDLQDQAERLARAASLNITKLVKQSASGNQAASETLSDLYDQAARNVDYQNRILAQIPTVEFQRRHQSQRRR